MRVGLLVVDEMVDSGYAVVRDVLDAANVLAPRLQLPEPLVHVRSYGLSDTVTTSHGMTLRPTPWQQVHDDRPDVLVTPSMGLLTPPAVVDAVRDHAVLADVLSLHEAGVSLAGACSGTFFLAEAGVLDGRNSTTSWWLGPAFRARYPRVDLDERQALAVDGDITTAGAAFAHIDLAMSLVHRISPALSDLVGSYLAVGDRPRQGEMIVPSVLAAADPVLSAFDRYVRDNLARPFQVGDAAQALGISERTLQRATSGALGIPPIRYVQQVRIDHAVHLLRTTDRSLDRIAETVGYRDAATLRNLIRRRRGATVGELRRRTRGS